MLAHFYAIEWEFIAHFLLQITPTEYILEVTLASKAIKSNLRVDGFSEIFYCKCKKEERDDVNIIISRCTSEFD